MGKKLYIKTIHTNPVEMRKRIEDTENKRIKDLRNKSKPLYELVEEKNFYVKSVLGISDSTSFSPSSEILIGGRSPRYSGGHSNNVRLEVMPHDSTIPVRVLTFYGNSIVESGDFIRVKIPLYTEERLYPFSENSEKVYIPRNFKAEESAIEIKLKAKDGCIRRKGGSIRRIDRSVDYERFQKISRGD